MPKYVFLFILIVLCPMTRCTQVQQSFILYSPDSTQVITINIGESIRLNVVYRDHPVIRECRIGMVTENRTLGHDPVITDKKQTHVDRVIHSIVPTRSSTIHDFYNELTLTFEGHYSVTFRAYMDGVAYRFETRLDEEQIIRNEILDLDLGPDYNSYYPAEERLISHYERSYKVSRVDEINPGTIASLPVLFQQTAAEHVLVTEADLYDYPGLFLEKVRNNQFRGRFPKAVIEWEPVKGRGSDRNEMIKRETDYIALTKGTRSFPWRIFIISDNDADLLTTNLVYQLSRPSQLENYGWIRPGKVAWDWWNALNIYDVDFKSGVNTETYKYYIDFASAFGLDYIILDEGWSESTLNTRAWKEEIDVKELVDYGHEKQVGIILWTLWKPLDKDMQSILDLYQEWGVKGIKVDFMQRADQEMVNFYERTAREAAKRELLVDFHGAFKPAGLSRAYPNVLSFEGVKGLEHNKWSSDITPEHNITLPFTRMVAGPMDYTPGAMNNAHEENFAIRFTRPMGMGTRCHQLAMYIIYESPLQMLADNPSKYYIEEECTRFISAIPTTWDTTIVLDSKIADYLVVARRHGDTWYLGAMTDGTPRSMNVDLTFLPELEYNIISFGDGMNADKVAIDYVKKTGTVKNTDSITIRMERGGGYAAIISGQ